MAKKVSSKRKDSPYTQFKLYHGTSLSAWRKYQKNKSIDIKNDLSRWLSAKGIYLFLNNPFLAFRFALEKVDYEKALARENSSTSKNGLIPVVLEVKLKKISTRKILDLTTAQGHHLLWDGHRYLSRIVLGKKFIELAKCFMRDGQTKEDRDYFKSCIANVFKFPNVDKEHFERFFRYMGIPKADVNQAYDILRSIPHFTAKDNTAIGNIYNYDCAVLTELIRQHKYALVIGAIQEGLTYNEQWHNHLHETEGIEGFYGLRYRDHVEFCVTNPKIVQWPPKRLRKLNIEQFDEKFWSEYQRFKDPYSRLERRVRI